MSEKPSFFAELKRRNVFKVAQRPLRLTENHISGNLAL